MNQSAPNLVKMYVTIRSRKSWIMNVIGPELCLHSSIYKYRPLITKYGHNMYDKEILDEFNYESNPTVTSGVICP